ncbi:Short-chain dehydrogenase/reductase family protein [Mycena venus]|uniref:Short-chain dehydrogenase/reductase family protein n=1 Tax=Mycena venus TaxID=2733690 RepID=A0A8H6YRS6_9AGAR|nr:Short-chain dehydrogenase/reductase family protein [Mycena venus]
MSTTSTFGPTTTADEVAAAFAEEIKDKIVLVTGTSINGIGFDTARVIAKHAKLVVITGHSEERLKLAEEAIKADVPTANIRRLIVDLGSFASVRQAAAEVNSLPDPLHVLINNAAAPIGPFKLTADGLESQMALLAAKTDTYTPRVVFVAARAHRMCSGVNFDMLTKPEGAKAVYNTMDVAAQVKCANILIASELARRGKSAVNVYSLHPGMIHTNVHQGPGVELRPIYQAAGIMSPDGRPINGPGRTWKTIPQGAATTVVAAFDPHLDAFSGAYLDDCAVATDTVAPHSADPEIAAKLWVTTEEIIGEKLSFEI